MDSSVNCIGREWLQCVCGGHSVCVCVEGGAYLVSLWSVAGTRHIDRVVALPYEAGLIPRAGQGQ